MLTLQIKSPPGPVLDCLKSGLELPMGALPLFLAAQVRGEAVTMFLRLECVSSVCIEQRLQSQDSHQKPAGWCT